MSPWTAQSVYGTSPQAPSIVAAPTQPMGLDDMANGWRGLIDPRNPLTWLGVVLLVTVGAAGVAGSVRLGRAKFSAGVDQA